MGSLLNRSSRKETSNEIIKNNFCAIDSIVRYGPHTEQFSGVVESFLCKLVKTLQNVKNTRIKDSKLELYFVYILNTISRIIKYLHKELKHGEFVAYGPIHNL